MKNILYTFLLISPLLFIFSCKKDVEGCTDASAVNYNSDATQNDDSCLFDSDGDGIYDSDEVEGCTDSLACNFDIYATDNNFSCEYPDACFDCQGIYNPICIGSEAYGGIIFYVDESGEHGLVASVEDLEETYEWGCYNVEVEGADGISIGTGYQNTMDIVNQGCATEILGGITAAQAAIDAEINGYSDWYLPSKDEFVEMNNTIGYGGGNIGGFETSNSTVCWSSSEDNINRAWVVNFDDGDAGYGYKSSPYRVRVIRAF